MRDKVDFFYLGPPKTGSTWLFRCLAAHPDVNAPARDELYYFDRYFDYGAAWLDGFYQPDHQGVRIDCTPAAIYNVRALRRILDYNPAAKFCFGLRHPIERAFSAYWHVKKQNRVQWRFEDVYSNYYIHQAFFETSLIAEGVRFLKAHAPPDHVHFFRFEDIAAQPQGVISAVYEFAGVSADFSPPDLHRKVNAAGHKQTLATRVGSRLAGLLFGHNRGQDVGALEAFLTGKGELERGINSDLYNKLLALCQSEIDALEEMLALDLSAWREERKG